MKKIDIQDYQKRDSLIPINELNENDRKFVFQRSKVLELEPRTLHTPEEGRAAYLLEGEVTLFSSGFVSEKFTHNDVRALSPLFDINKEQDSVLFLSHGALLEVNETFLEGLVLQARAKTSKDFKNSEESVLKLLKEKIKQNQITIPDLSLSARKLVLAMREQNIKSQEIVEIIENDTELANRLLVVANSSFYSSWREIKELKDAIRILGAEVAKNLALGLSIKPLYQSKTQLIKSELKFSYEQNCKIASFAFLLSREFSEDLNPEFTITASLLLGVGSLPIYFYIDEHPETIQIPQQLGQSIEELNYTLSKIIFSQWFLDEQYLQFIEHFEDWNYSHDDMLNYTDILIAARLIYFYQNKPGNITNLNFKQLPVMKKLNIFSQYETIDAYLQKINRDYKTFNQLLN